MKKTFLVLMLVFFLISVMAAGEQEVVIKDMEPFCYAAMDFKGSFTQMEKNIGIFMQEFFKQGLTPAGPVLGIYYNDPMQVKEEDLQWAVGFPVAKDAEVAKPLKKVTTKFKKAAVYLHIGPYEQLDKAYMKIMKYINDKGYKMVMPTYDRYLNDPKTVKPEELKTETIVPVEKK